MRQRNKLLFAPVARGCAAHERVVPGVTGGAQTTMPLGFGTVFCLGARGYGQELASRVLDSMSEYSLVVVTQNMAIGYVGASPPFLS